MAFDEDRLREILTGVEYLGHYQRLLKRVLTGELREIEFNFDEYEPVDGGELRSNVGIACGFKPPWPDQPTLNECFPLLLPPGTTRISITDLGKLAERAGKWCDGISKALKKLIESQGQTTE